MHGGSNGTEEVSSDASDRARALRRSQVGEVKCVQEEDFGSTARGQEPGIAKSIGVIAVVGIGWVTTKESGACCAVELARVVVINDEAARGGGVEEFDEVVGGSKHAVVGVVEDAIINATVQNAEKSSGVEAIQLVGTTLRVESDADAVDLGIPEVLEVVADFVSLLQVEVTCCGVVNDLGK